MMGSAARGGASSYQAECTSEICVFIGLIASRLPSLT